jgi:predicted Zn-ribbon and HTH transcriptional regulator
VPVAAAWSSEGEGIEPYRDPVTANKAILTAEQLVTSHAKSPNATIRKRIEAQAGNLFSKLWPHLEAEADALGAEAKKGLLERARKESDDLRKLLVRQKTAIDKAQARLRQADLFELKDKEQKRQVDKDLEHLERRRKAADQEIEIEPRAIEALYEVQMTRLTPVGMIVTWPEAMT